MPTTVPLGEDRRAAIADAAIRLVATRGLRGLTHRAVDAEAGLPPGSTSYYLRTRGALLAACVDRVLARDLAAAPAGSPSWPPSVAESQRLLTEMLVHLVSERAEDQLTRYELSLEASRRPELREAIDRGGRQLRDQLAGMLAALGVPDPDEAAWPVAAMLDGLLYDRVAGVGTTLPAETFQANVRRAVTILLKGLLAG